MRKLSIIILLLGTVTTVPTVYAQKVYTLSECRKLALENNVKIKDAELGINQAVEQEKEAYSKYFPTVYAAGAYFKSNDYLIHKDLSLSAEDQKDLAQIITQMGLNPSILSSLPTSYDVNLLNHGLLFGVLAMEPIYAGGQISNSNKLAKLQTEIRKLQMQQSHDDILNTTEVYYNQLLTLYEKEQTLNAVDKLLERIHQDADNAYKAGVKNKNDVLTVELKQNSIATDRLKLDNGIKVCKLVLAQYIGKNGENIKIDTTLINDIKDPSYYLTDHDVALNGRVEAQLLNKNVEANELQTKIKKGSLLPTVSVGALGGFNDLSGSGRANIIGLATVSIPISGWWSDIHAVKHQQIAEQIAREDRENSRQMLIIQMQSAYNDLENAYKQIDLAKKSMEKSTENLRLNEDYYHAGTSTMSDLLDAQSNYQQSRNQYTDAVVQYLNCRTAYLLDTNRQVQ